MTAATILLPGFTERRKDERAVSLRWFEAGEGRPIVLVHGFGGAASNWTLVAPRLVELGRVVIPDLPGHGGSSPFPAPPETLDPYADRVAPLVGADSALVVGHSLGGAVALRLAVRRPDCVRGLVVAGCAGISSSTREAERLLMLASMLRIGKKISRWRREIGRSAFLRTLAFGGISTADPRALSAQAVEGFLAGSALYTDIGTAGRALVRTELRLELEHVRSPVLVLHGAGDRQVPLEDAFEYARRLRAPLRTIADCGHLLISERPEAIVDAISDWIRHVDELPVEREAIG